MSSTNFCPDRALIVLVVVVGLLWSVGCEPKLEAAEDAEESVGPDIPVAVPDVSSQRGRIVADPDNPAWLRYEDGSPYFLCGPGDPEGFLYRGTRNPDGTRDGDQMALIAKLAPTGANSIYLMAVRSHGGDGEPDENPFVDSDPDQGLDDDILDQWETWFSAMDAAGITIFFFFYDDDALVWDTGDEIRAPERAFIEGLVNRFEHHDHLIWVVAEEFQEEHSPSRVSSIAAIIRAADDRDHPIAVHQLHGLNFAFPDDPNIDQFAIQYNVDNSAELHEGMLRAWRSAAGAYNLNMSEAQEHGSGASARAKSWAVAMGGAYVMVLYMDIESTPTSDLEDCGRLRLFMESTDFDQMAPHDELAMAATLYVLARPGRSYIAYSLNSHGVLGLRDVTAGTYELTWFDPATGHTVTESLEVEGGNAFFAVPDSLGDEVAVYLRRR